MLALSLGALQSAELQSKALVLLLLLGAWLAEEMFSQENEKEVCKNNLEPPASSSLRYLESLEQKLPAR